MHCFDKGWASSVGYGKVVTFDSVITSDGELINAYQLTDWDSDTET